MPKGRYMKKAALLALIWLSLITVISGCSKNEKIISTLYDAKNARIGEFGLIAHKHAFPDASLRGWLDILRFIYSRTNVDWEDANVTSRCTLIIMATNL